MKAFLTYRDHDFDLQCDLPGDAQALVQDLALNTLFSAMAGDDDFIFDVAKVAVLSGSEDIDTILYRQGVLRDCLKNPAVAREIYGITIQARENKRKHWMGIFTKRPAGILYEARVMMQMFVGLLGKLRDVARKHSGKFESDGFRTFFAMIEKELDDDYFCSIQAHLKELKFGNGVLISAELGRGNEGTNYVLRKPQDKGTNWLARIFARNQRGYVFHIAERDEAGAMALEELRDRGIALVADAVAQAADHIDSFFNMLRTELAFYIGCLNLSERLAQLGMPISFPVPVDSSQRRYSCQGLYDVCLALNNKGKIVGNDVNADNKVLVIITGANQGGKSTFLRSVGLAQLMMESGMFVPAEAFSANICDGVFTHYKRQEDVTMKSGKLDEELGRMSEIVEMMTSKSLVLFNESFAATNDREGSEIARQIIKALVEKGIKVFFVTHLYEFAHSFYEQSSDSTIFLLAERQADGGRTYRLVEGEPLQTSYGRDLYDQIFGVRG
ncbi:MAG: DNA mismatch repair protein MutS [Thermodesulfobacteriota bacterium]